MAAYDNKGHLPVVVSSIQKLSCFSDGQWSKVNLGLGGMDRNQRLVKVESNPKPERNVVRREDLRILKEPTPKWLLEKLQTTDDVTGVDLNHENWFSRNLQWKPLDVNGVKFKLRKKLLAQSHEEIKKVLY